MGTIIPRLTANFTSTSEAGKYLYCDGSTFDTIKYPKLYAILGINQLPDLRGRFLEGDDIGGNVLEAALPNIRGTISGGGAVEEVASFSGAFYNTGWFKGGNGDWSDLGIGFNASLSNSIYKDSCNTVQPPAVTVRYYIRAK